LIKTLLFLSFPGQFPDTSSKIQPALDPVQPDQPDELQPRGRHRPEPARDRRQQHLHALDPVVTLQEEVQASQEEILHLFGYLRKQRSQGKFEIPFSHFSIYLSICLSV
jgi:hypothetical protein